MTLEELSVGKKAKITAVGGEKRFRSRLLDMGVTPGATIYLRKKAPMGDPIEITIRGYELSLRKAEASLVEIEVLD